MKSEPGYSTETISQSTMGTPVKVTDSTGYWYRIVTPEGYEGWTTARNITLVSDRDFSEWRRSERVIVTDYFGVVRESPEKDAAVISDCVMGNILNIDRRRESPAGHVAVILPNGEKGYLPSEKTFPLREWLENAAPATGEKIVATAQMFMGFPYLWGGLSPKGMDCSGLAKFAYFMNGIIILRDGRQQIETGCNLPISDIAGTLQAGDLLFFGTRATGQKPRKVTHVGIYIADGEMIHSSLTVRKNTLYHGKEDSYTSKELVGATRIIGHQDTEKGIVSVLNHPWYFKEQNINH